MSCSREVRVPFMDYRLVEMFGKLPPNRKLKRGWTKAIFGEVMECIIPKQIQYRKDKKGFDLPVDRWIKGPLKESMSMVFDNPMIAEEGGFIKRCAVQESFLCYLKRDVLVSHKDIFNIFCFET